METQTKYGHVFRPKMSEVNNVGVPRGLGDERHWESVTGTFYKGLRNGASQGLLFHKGKNKIVAQCPKNSAHGGRNDSNIFLTAASHDFCCPL
jgi:hypothetical protein